MRVDDNGGVWANKAKLERRHFELMADIIKSMSPEQTKAITAYYVARVCERSNGAFNRERFLKRVGVSETQLLASVDKDDRQTT